jgi:hypothetical protein
MNKKKKRAEAQWYNKKLYYYYYYYYCSGCSENKKKNVLIRFHHCFHTYARGYATDSPITLTPQCLTAERHKSHRVHYTYTAVVFTATRFNGVPTRV